MDTALRAMLDELYAEGLRYDDAQTDRLAKRRNLEPPAAELVWVVAQATAARSIVEIGTSNGFSTLWLADATRAVGGRVVSVDVDASVQEQAAENLARAGLDALVELRQGDGGEVLAGLDAGSVDLLFLDAERPEYPPWWPAVQRALRPGGLLVVDNVTSHPDEVAPFLELVRAEPGWAHTIAEVGKGEFMAVKPATG
jgi:predicted O-methyltransferase YrrM